VISALMVVEINNVKQQEHKRCKYCLGTGMNVGFSPIFVLQLSTYTLILISMFEMLYTIILKQGRSHIHLSWEIRLILIFK
jgi:hypothetical protein